MVIILKQNQEKAKEGEGNGKQKRKPELHLPAWQNEWKMETCRRLGRGT